MCGINGIIYKKNIPSYKEIIQMNKAISHRGPDDQGYLKFQNCMLGHQRLSIQDLSLRGHQPMSVDGRYWIIFNGEIYNFKSIRKNLTNLGYTFFTETDTEVILNSFKEWGSECFCKFNGMWSLCILDKHNKTLFFCRDRYGVKPFYYYLDDTKLLFSSEIKGLYSSNLNLELDHTRAFSDAKELEGNFSTIYKNVKIVPPGTFFEINLDNLNISKTRWWNSLQNIPAISPNFKHIKNELRERLINATKLRLVSDAKIAISLSGGLDSSTIFGIINNIFDHQNINLNPFIYKDENLTFNNAIELSNFYKKKPIVVNAEINDKQSLSQRYSAIELTQNFFSQLSLYKKQNELGYKVSIDGHGADECLGGYLDNIKYFSFDAHNQIFNVYKTILNFSNKETLIKIIEKFKLVNHVSSIIKENVSHLFENHSKLENSYLNEEVVKSHKKLVNYHFDEDFEELKNFNISFQSSYCLSNHGYLQWLLTKWDKASMSASVEMRAPFMDYNFFEYALSIPAEHKIVDGFNKSVLRQTFSDLILETISQDRIKQGLISNFTQIDENFMSFAIENCDDKLFINNDLWNGKKILSEIKNLKSIDSKQNLKNFHEIFKLFLLEKGMKERKDLALINENFSNNDRCNLLNKKNKATSTTKVAS